MKYNFKFRSQKLKKPRGLSEEIVLLTWCSGLGKDPCNWKVMKKQSLSSHWFIDSHQAQTQLKNKTRLTQENYIPNNGTERNFHSPICGYWSTRLSAFESNTGFEIAGPRQWQHHFCERCGDWVSWAHGQISSWKVRNVDGICQKEEKWWPCLWLGFLRLRRWCFQDLKISQQMETWKFYRRSWSFGKVRNGRYILMDTLSSLIWKSQVQRIFSYPWRRAFVTPSVTKGHRLE